MTEVKENKEMRKLDIFLQVMEGWDELEEHWFSVTSDRVYLRSKPIIWFNKRYTAACSRAMQSYA